MSFFILNLFLGRADPETNVAKNFVRQGYSRRRATFMRAQKLFLQAQCPFDAAIKWSASARKVYE